ncbi:alanine racemase [Amylibacter marinus]|uniref:Alanine racemase n=1 Tax=Amylibacter marinus TaxID=1475483 RepID=A0ABQ5VR67_9RHOB|nr:alanine racemase [Amylibacter marinus]GLQ33901.1 alanine racemase [Amylibacter marinus]
MSTSTLHINLNNLCQNWRDLDAQSAPHVETAAVVKADGYGLGSAQVATALQKAGANSFFVALPSEGAVLRKALGNAAKIYVFSGMMLSDAKTLHDHKLIPMLNAPEQMMRFRTELPDADFGIQLDTGMNRLGMEANEFAPHRDSAQNAQLIISHLACADTPDHPQNRAQLAEFHALTDGLSARRSLAATGGTLLGAEYHFDLCRPGIGLYGGHPFTNAAPVATLSIPVIQTRVVAAGETVGYSATWVAQRNSRVATIAAGYADGLIRAMGGGDICLFADGIPCPIIGRVSMDLITVDVTDLDHVPDQMDLLTETQTIEHLADAAGTIGYEILTNLGARYARNYAG